MNKQIEDYVKMRIESVEKLPDSCCKDTALLELRAILSLAVSFRHQDELMADLGFEMAFSA